MQITYMQKEFVKTMKQKNLGKYHELYLKSDALSLVDLFENFRKKGLQNHHLDPAKFLSVPGLA